MIKKFLSYAAKGRYAFTNITGQKKMHSNLSEAELTSIGISVAYVVTHSSKNGVNCLYVGVPGNEITT